MADILEILSPIVSNGETINETHFETLRVKLNEVIRKVNQGGDTPFDPKSDPTDDRSLQYWATLTKTTWLDTEDVLHVGDESDPSYEAFPVFASSNNPLLRVKEVYGIGRGTDGLGRKSLEAMLRGASNCRQIYTKYWNTSLVTTIANFANAIYPTWIMDTTLWDLSSLVSTTTALRNANLKSFIGGIDADIDIDARTDIKCWNNLAISLDLTNSSNLPRASIVAMFRGLATLPEGTTKTITLSATAKGRLTEADKLIATSKGWTIA